MWPQVPLKVPLKQPGMYTAEASPTGGKQANATQRPSDMFVRGKAL
jgi:hypothetical protein